MYRKLTLCSDRGGYEAIPERPFRMDLHKVAERLTNQGVAVLDARVLLVAKLPPEVTIGRDGRLLFKTPELATAETGFRRLRELLELPPSLLPPGPG